MLGQLNLRICTLIASAALFIPQALDRPVVTWDDVSGIVIPQPKQVVYKATESELECAAKNAYYEARGEPIKGQLAVIAVTVNRAKSKRFPSNICQVVHQKWKDTCQFSWVCMSNLGRVSKEHYARLKALAVEYMNGDHPDPTNGALFFHAHTVKPRWANKPAIIIGAHLFYKDIK